jgi:hypothetical protein
LASITNKDYVNFGECVAEDGSVLPPFIVLPGKLHMEDWYKNTNVDSDYSVAVSEYGYMNEHLTLDWLDHFHRHTLPRTTGTHRLLLLDGRIALFPLSSL